MLYWKSKLAQRMMWPWQLFLLKNKVWSRSYIVVVALTERPVGIQNVFGLCMPLIALVLFLFLSSISAQKTYFILVRFSLLRSMFNVHCSQFGLSSVCLHFKCRVPKRCPRFMTEYHRLHSMNLRSTIAKKHHFTLD